MAAPETHTMPAAVEIDALIQQARQLLRQGELAQALALYEQAVAANETHVSAQEGLATAAFMIQDYDRAITHFQRVCKLDPRRVQPLVNMGAVYNRKGEFQQATKVLRQALSKDRKCAEAYYNLGIAHRGLNQLSMAVSAYREAIRLSPEMAEAYLNLANAYQDMGNTQQALLNYRRALEIKPSFERARRGLEKAQNAAAQAKHSLSPFGRLVSVDDARAAPAEPGFRTLTPQERFEDRAAVHNHSKDLERAAAVALNQCREQLEPRLLALTHAFTQGGERYDFSDELAAFQQARHGFDQVMRLLADRSETLRQHDRLMQK
jgi:tetratricopeptide (TPR) repeat protein